MLEFTDPLTMMSRHEPTAPGLPSRLANVACHRFVSPHYDDITLSCGGTVATVTQADLRADVTIVFGAEPDPAMPLSPFAEHLHAHWGLAPGSVVASRRSEESAAAALLGSNVDVLPFPDAIYRGRHYTSGPALFGEPVIAEQDLPDMLATALGMHDPAEAATPVYCPLAIGGHVDHRLAFSAGVKLALAGRAVYFYEDVPYALRPGATAARVAAIRAAGLDLRPAMSIDVASTWMLKVDAIMAYASQVAGLFGPHVGQGDFRTGLDEVLCAYALQAGNGVLGERFWSLDHSITPG
jgi:LmbE family N-acetylglucosaminyl deacetylase